MRNLYDLYLSYLKLASLSMASAFIIFSIVAGFLLGNPRIIMGTLGAAVVVAVCAYMIRKSSSVRIAWSALDESWKPASKSGGANAQPARTINTKALRILLPLRRRILSWSASERMYVIGIVILCLFIPLFFLSILLQLIELLRVSTVSVLVGFGFFAGGATIEIIKVVLLIWKNTIGKFVLGLLAGLVANISYVSARAEVNGITGMDPSSFTTAVATLSVIMAPLVWLKAVLIVLSLIFLTGYVAAVSFHYFKMLMYGPLLLAVRNSIPYRFLLDKRKYQAKSRPAGFDMARFIGVISLLAFLLFPTQYLEGSIRRMRGFFIWVFVETETYRSSRCPNHHNGERVAFLSDGRILVVKPDRSVGYFFEIRKCE